MSTTAMLLLSGHLYPRHVGLRYLGYHWHILIMATNTGWAPYIQQSFTRKLNLPLKHEDLFMKSALTRE